MLSTQVGLPKQQICVNCAKSKAFQLLSGGPNGPSAQGPYLQAIRFASVGPSTQTRFSQFLNINPPLLLSSHRRTFNSCKTSLFSFFFYFNGCKTLLIVLRIYFSFYFTLLSLKYTNLIHYFLNNHLRVFILQRFHQQLIGILLKLTQNST